MEQIDKYEIRSVKQLVALLKPGESFISEEHMFSPEYPNIPKEVRKFRLVKTSTDTVRVDKWE